MKYLAILVLAVLAACSTSTDSIDADGIIDDGSADSIDDEVDLGSNDAPSLPELVEGSQALQAQCGSPNKYGTDVNEWGNRPCDINNSSMSCSFPNEFQYAFTAGLRNGWTAGDRMVLGVYGTAANTFFHNNFGSWETLVQPFTWTNNIGVASSQKVNIDKGSTGPDTALLFKNYVHMACLTAVRLNESKPIGNAYRCYTWAATVDYDKLKANVPTGQVGNAMRNIFQKIYAVGIGLGVNGKPSCFYVTTDALCPSQVGTDWYAESGLGAVREDSWAKDYRIKQDLTNDLSCYL